MNVNVGQELAQLKRMSMNELRAKYEGVCGEATVSRNKEWLIRRVAWRLQSLAEGDISNRTRQRAAELANDADLRTMPPKPAKVQLAPISRGTLSVGTNGDNRLPMPGAIITREYKGQQLQVLVLANGFEFEGTVYKSLSAVAKSITGSHLNGYLFFKLRREVA